ncbi:hypothetical protein ACIPUC_07300 [Streptomyces sp. LARHCF249]
MKRGSSDSRRKDDSGGNADAWRPTLGGTAAGDTAASVEARRGRGNTAARTAARVATG